ncbi:MAG: ParB/RepB/Spo0J family partition protein, partial [Nitrosomonas ureae]
GVQAVPLEQIDDNPFQPRQSYDPATLADLADSIEREGLQQPPAVRRTPDGRWQLVFGHRRKRACELLRAKDPKRFTTMTVIVVEATDGDMAVRAMIENRDREGLTAVDEAHGIRALIEFGMNQAEVARRLGLSPATVSSKLRLLRSPTEVQQMVALGTLSERQAGALAPAWDLPEPVLRAAREQTGWGSLEYVMRRAANGASSDELRDSVKGMTRRFTESLQNDEWVDVDLGLGDQVLAAVCEGCALRMVIADEPRCGDEACYKLKARAWAMRERQALQMATGVTALDIGGEYSGFWGSNRVLAIEHEINKSPLCANLRVKPSNNVDAFRCDGVDVAHELVCAERNCSCLVAIRNVIKQDGEAAWHLLRKQTLAVVKQALQEPTPDLLRLWAQHLAGREDRQDAQNWDIEKVITFLARKITEDAAPYKPEENIVRARQTMEKLLATARLAVPWSDDDQRVPEQEPSSADAVRAALASVGVFVNHYATGARLPTTESVAEMFDLLDDARIKIPSLSGDAERIDLSASHAGIYERLAGLSDRVQAQTDGAK